MDNPFEKERLIKKCNPEKVVKKYITPHINKNTKHILDMGCGPGVIAKEIVLKHPNIEVVGADISPLNIEYALKISKQQDNLNFYVEDAHKTSFKKQDFDIVFSRFMMEYNKKPNQIIREFKRLMKINGKLLLLDLDAQLVTCYPISKTVKKEINTVLKMLKKTGFDPYVGRKLYSLVYKNNFSKIGVKVEPYHLKVGETDKHNFELWNMKFNSLKDYIKKHMNSSIIEKYVNDFLELLLSKESFMYSNLIYLTANK